ncbi:MAG: discoidin domain-containing protein, partial [Odoribacter sp.]|nr:discoidin domain-containing protein [Odoribacter sp.]
VWHTQWGENAIPFDLVMDLRTINQLDKFHYLPRTDGGNGVLLKGNVYHSMDKENWIQAGDFEWERNGEVKIFRFTDQPTARYIKISVTKGVGNYGSGRELYVFKVAGTESYRPGDINNDRLIDMNDFTSYMNYTGLRLGDADFEGYVSNGDVNRNGLIDAYDISVVATQLRGGVKKGESPRVDGMLQLSTNKHNYTRNEVIEVRVKGSNLRSVNALSFALPYNQQDYEFIDIEPLQMNDMENLTNDRLHTNGTKALYPTFVNIGEKKTLEGNRDLFILKFKAKNNLKFDLKLQDGLLVDKHLNTHKF